MAEAIKEKEKGAVGDCGKMVLILDLVLFLSGLAVKTANCVAEKTT